MNHKMQLRQLPRTQPKEVEIENMGWRKKKKMRSPIPDNSRNEGTWMAQSVNHLTLGFSSGHNLRVMRLSLMLGSMLIGEFASPSPSAPPPAPALHAVSQINNLF